jgi:hypothetical protein
LLYLAFGPTDAWWQWVLAGSLLAAAIWPVIQYAWTFFYLRLVETEVPFPTIAERLRRASPPRVSVARTPEAAPTGAAAEAGAALDTGAKPEAAGSSPPSDRESPVPSS